MGIVIYIGSNLKVKNYEKNGKKGCGDFQSLLILHRLQTVGPLFHAFSLYTNKLNE